MKTRKAISPELRDRIQELIDHTPPMTHDRLRALMTREDLPRAAAISGFNHVFRIAEFALRLVSDDDGEVDPSFDQAGGEHTCPFCHATTCDLGYGWHRDSCGWAQLVEVIKGNAGVDSPSSLSG
jgi:hypothetical protein